MLPEPQKFEILRLLHEQPQTNQRDVARALGVSLGKANYCLRALVEKGWVKFGNFRHNPDKRQYAYLLTKAGLEEKTRLTLEFLRFKMAEYENLEKEIRELKGQLDPGAAAAATDGRQRPGQAG